MQRSSRRRPPHVLAVAELQGVQQLLEDQHRLALGQLFALTHIVQQRPVRGGGGAVGLGAGVR